MRSGVFCWLWALATLVCACAETPRTAQLSVPPGFSLEAIAKIAGARELASLPDGGLIVGTSGANLYVVLDAEASPDASRILTRLDDDLAAGVSFSAPRSEIYVGTMHHVWAIPYRRALTAAQPRSIADVRTGPVAPGTDGDVHNTTSVAFADGLVYVAAGSSCNATMEGGKKPCVEVDATRAAISVMRADGTGFRQRAKHVRNAIALAVDPQTQAVWLGGAGQDDLPLGHPYEFLDDLSLRKGVADYGWPNCEENRHVYWPGSDCSSTVEPLIVLPAYSTIIGAAFYPMHQTGAYAFPARYRGGLFVTAHGSWHTNATGCYAAPPRVVFVPMDLDRPVKPVNWTNPTTQWTDFFTGFQSGCRTRIGRPTGIAVGSEGSLFVADDASGTIYRIRPTRHSSR
jgi:glucose/arabinose dehydrogenase